MRLRGRQRNVVIWSSSAGSAGRHAITFSHPVRRRRVRRGARISGQLALLGLLSIARGEARLRWQLLLAGGVLTVAGIVLRHDPAGVILLPGLLLLFSAPLIPDIPRAEYKRHLQLEAELAVYSTPAARRDLEATLAQYPDRDTAELRTILSGQARTAGRNRVPGSTHY
jgi:hypothetical protein